MRSRTGGYADVGKVDDQHWAWDCRVCHAGEPHHTWRDAYDTARHHLSSHRQFGFQPPNRRPTT